MLYIIRSKGGMIYMADFQGNLKRLRIYKGFKTAKEFAAALGIGYTRYINYENKGREPDYETLCKIAAALNVSIDDLLGYRPDAWETTKNTLEDYGYKLTKLNSSHYSLTNEKGIEIPFTDKREITSLVERAQATTLIIDVPILRSQLEACFYRLLIERCRNLNIVPPAETDAEIRKGKK